MSFSRNTLFSLVFSVAALGLGGCGGGSNASAPVTPGACQAGSVYSPQYGCLAQGACGPGMGQAPQGGCVYIGNSAITSCTQTNQGPMVMTQRFGCLPQGNCPVGQGAHVVNGINTCELGQMPGSMMGGYTGCPVNQVMTARGCLPQYPGVCEMGWGYLNRVCYKSVAVRSQTTISTTDDSGDDETDGDEAYVRVRKVKVRRHCRR